MIVKIAALCVAVAMICSALRTQRPELASAVSLAGGIAALGLLADQLSQAARWLEEFRGAMYIDGDISAAVLKGVGVSIVSELGAQVCADAGESALAGRITLASRVIMLGLCAPLLVELAGMLDDILA